MLPKSANSISSGRRSYFGSLAQRNLISDEYTVLDSQKVPANRLETIEKSLLKVNRFLQDKFGSKEAFETHLREKADVDRNGNISVDEMKAMVTDVCADEIASRRLTRRDLEGFLSAFKYSAHGATAVGSVAPLVFENDSNKLALALATRVRTNPPPTTVNGDLAAAAEGDSLADEATARRLRGILTQIEDTSFQCKPKTFQVFRAFDEDGDGYVSYKDFEKHLLKNKIFASQADISLLMKEVFDKEGSGFIDFARFKEKFGPNMSKQIDVAERELHMPNLVPNKEKLNEYGTRSQSLRATMSSVRKSFQPEIDQSKCPLFFAVTVAVEQFRVGALHALRSQACTPEYVCELPAGTQHAGLPRRGDALRLQASGAHASEQVRLPGGGQAAPRAHPGQQRAGEAAKRGNASDPHPAGRPGAACEADDPHSHEGSQQRHLRETQPLLTSASLPA